METQIIQEVEKLKDDLMDALKRLVAINSVQTKKESSAPYGSGVKKALKECLKISKELGFKTKNLSCHIGYAYTGKQDDYIGVFGHVDVVQAQGLWNTDPFSLYNDGTFLYGRGVMDDKGPILACLFALKALKNAGIEPKIPIRIIFGCNEESGSNDIKHYLKHEKPPLMGFSPDCQFPAVYSERGILRLEISGLQAEMVEFCNRYMIGKDKKIMNHYLSALDNAYGKVEVKQIELKMKNNRLHLEGKIWYPYQVEADAIIDSLKAILKEDMEISILEDISPMYVPKENDLVQILSKAYGAICDDDDTPVVTSGATYAKVVPNIIPFGPSFNGKDNSRHHENECLSINDLVRMTKIYAIALYYLSK